ncbi:aminotransferase class I/II-fold pyridoxal phosphate-dependent enzyme [Chitinophaga filiformis]|uniref:aminotransferase class I/II-fold pyridoxal phosphate-dependent enzyme n=1 Tax=Chitinophaga filiformis TaxID=104663 RepID=UPI001F35AE54|nr:aminotransferase class I/II-fold pyridoxal phosphate-dependent enzyme [Chitinophaga filiformis]MCF6407393.1 aminotransferase class I/II-fold pyridoxal phosphate-dependent enzyme [Chitinophaga filiformis]
MQAQFTHTTPTSRTSISGKEYLFFSGFSYLGLHALPAFKELLKQGIDEYGTTFISSRIANTRLQLYDELEHALAVLLQQQASATFSSGYLASQSAVQYAATRGELLYAPSAHPALWKGQPHIPVQDWSAWAAATVDKVNAHPDERFVIVADSVNPLTSTINDFSWLQQLKRQVLVLIDDAHGIGVIGANGNGIVHTLPQHPPVRYLLAASLAKAYSAQGGVVSGHAADIAAIKKLPLFTGATPMMPANAWAFLQSFSLHAEQRALLQQRINYFTSLTGNIGYLHNPFHLPVFLLKDNAGIEKYLLEHDIMISSFGYPNPDSPPVNRIIVSAQHSEEDLYVLHKLLLNR